MSIDIQPHLFSGFLSFMDATQSFGDKAGEIHWIQKGTRLTNIADNDKTLLRGNFSHRDRVGQTLFMATTVVLSTDRDGEAWCELRLKMMYTAQDGDETDKMSVVSASLTVPGNCMSSRDGRRRLQEHSKDVTMVLNLCHSILPTWVLADPPHNHICRYQSGPKVSGPRRNDSVGPPGTVPIGAHPRVLHGVSQGGWKNKAPGWLPATL
ncbi:hypothetical protein DFH07DRAFT_776773 [Mycena maculata]|uniref:Uncharacterized protein n=1 Tax=Mycena maculata TaxID=230809 RepID=A0AAD7N3Z6_9AGAR|nr:hypothetical protein DFH07DRAFT_776773 [Mycena maculata]